jgi:hypothetical protein
MWVIFLAPFFLQRLIRISKRPRALASADSYVIGRLFVRPLIYYLTRSIFSLSKGVHKSNCLGRPTQNLGKIHLNGNAGISALLSEVLLNTEAT